MSPNHCFKFPGFNKGLLRNELRKLVMNQIETEISLKHDYLMKLYEADRLNLPYPEEQPRNNNGLDVEICTTTNYISIDISEFKKKKKKCINECTISGCNNNGFKNNEFGYILLCHRHRYRCLVKNRYIRPQKSKVTGLVDTILIKYENVGYFNGLELKHNLGVIIHPKNMTAKHLSPSQYEIYSNNYTRIE